MLVGADDRYLFKSYHIMVAEVFLPDSPAYANYHVRCVFFLQVVDIPRYGQHSDFMNMAVRLSTLSIDIK